MLVLVVLHKTTVLLLVFCPFLLNHDINKCLIVYSKKVKKKMWLNNAQNNLNIINNND